MNKLNSNERNILLSRFQIKHPAINNSLMALYEDIEVIKDFLEYIHIHRRVWLAFEKVTLRNIRQGKKTDRVRAIAEEIRRRIGIEVSDTWIPAMALVFMGKHNCEGFFETEPKTNRSQVGLFRQTAA